jgi:hypothetical protein
VLEVMIAELCAVEKKMLGYHGHHAAHQHRLLKQLRKKHQTPGPPGVVQIWENQALKGPTQYY